MQPGTCKHCSEDLLSSCGSWRSWMVPLRTSGLIGDRDAAGVLRPCCSQLRYCVWCACRLLWLHPPVLQLVRAVAVMHCIVFRVCRTRHCVANAFLGSAVRQAQ